MHRSNLVSKADLDDVKKQGLVGLENDPSITNEAREKLEAMKSKLNEPKHFALSPNHKLSEEFIESVIRQRNAAYAKYRVLRRRIDRNKNRRQKGTGAALFKSQKTVDLYREYVEIINEADLLIEAFTEQV